MIAEIIALVDFIFNRSDKFKENKQNYLDNFIEPVFSQFKIVHNNYLETFNNYRFEIESSRILDIKTIINKIKKDSLFSQNLRDELLAPIENKLDNDFIRAIYDYLQLPYFITQISTSYPLPNFQRENLIEVLEIVDQEIPEIIIGDLKLTEVKKIFKIDPNYGGFAGSIRTYIAYYRYGIEAERIQANYNDLEKVAREQNEIKKILALECIDFLVKNIQGSYSYVVQNYWQEKSKFF
ncbi:MULTISPECIES: hypothetical protein [Nostoc]|uniref:Uncharacterized protein n=2 Tax=Nostoc TaxID=1177 RepID=A0ABR8IFB0_9NOSO|nr:MULTISPECIES: hypothetical protein [Nostoc]MBD2564554.1 hypothetical protein [Nostoc linckia FACHB-391]MBD2650108.1 hypothetical protein [Nostoc foliaceum FACHB-393]